MSISQSQQRVLSLKASLQSQVCKCFLTCVCCPCWLLFIQTEKIAGKMKILRQQLDNLEDKQKKTQQNIETTRQKVL